MAGEDTHDRRSALPARLELSLRNNVITSSFYCGQGELCEDVARPPQEAVDGYAEAIEHASAGIDSAAATAAAWVRPSWPACRRGRRRCSNV